MRRLPVLALAALAAAAVGCGGGDEPDARSERPAVAPVGQPRAGSVAQYADCGDWRRGTRAARMATIAQLRGQLTPQRSRTAASPLTDERAYEVLEKACAPAYAESLRLYKLYVRLQGFAPLAQ